MNNFVIETKQLTKVYGEQDVVKAVNIHVKKGRIYGLLGRNGAGKTTIMKMILGLTPITSGKVDVFGQDIKGREKQVFPRIGAIIETPGFYPNLTGTENLEIFAKLRGTVGPNAVKKALEVVGLPYKDKKLRIASNVSAIIGIDFSTACASFATWAFNSRSILLSARI